MKMLKMTMLDEIIIIILIILSFFPTLVISITNSNYEKSNIVLKIDNKIEEIILLDNQDESKIYEFNFGSNIGYIEVKGGRARMLEMNKEICPDAICSKTGWIDKNYQSIVCLPNKIVLTLEGSKNEEVDYKAY